jgi:hypothetical protein
MTQKSLDSVEARPPWALSHELGLRLACGQSATRLEPETLASPGPAGVAGMVTVTAAGGPGARVLTRLELN